MTTAQRLKNSFDEYYKAPLTLWKSIAGLGEVIRVGGEEEIKKAGAVENSLHLVLHGSGAILLHSEEKTVCMDLIFENEFLADYLSFIKRAPTPFSVITLEPSELFRISYTEFDRALRKSPHGEKIWRYASEALYTDKQLQQISLLTSTAAERYALILEHHPFVVQRIPQKYIASFLGVTPQSLSRIRSEVASQKLPNDN